MAKRRLDAILLQREYVRDGTEAFVLVTAGRVLVNGQKAISPAQLIADNAEVVVRSNKEFVGRGGLKLDAACKRFEIDVTDKICMDVGAATGGFTDVLLQRGAKRVYAIDTARGKIAQSIRDNPRVVLLERTDIRSVTVFPEHLDLVVIDVSLMSLREILPAVLRLISDDATVVALFKPQYETRNPQHLHAGVIRSNTVRNALTVTFEEWATAHQWEIRGRMESPIHGSKGNVEYLYLLKIQSTNTH